MDPDVNLAEQLKIAHRILNREPWSQMDGERLAELVEALDGWIRRGGFPPKAWARSFKAAADFERGRTELEPKTDSLHPNGF